MARNNPPQIGSDNWLFDQWRMALPQNLRTRTDNYNLQGAWKAGLTPDNVVVNRRRDREWHLGSRNPMTGELFKSPQHPTYDKMIETEIRSGYTPTLDVRTGQLKSIGGNYNRFREFNHTPGVDRTNFEKPVPSLMYSTYNYRVPYQNKQQVRNQVQPVKNKWDNAFFRNWAIAAGHWKNESGAAIPKDQAITTGSSQALVPPVNVPHNYVPNRNRKDNLINFNNYLKKAMTTGRYLDIGQADNLGYRQGTNMAILADLFQHQMMKYPENRKKAWRTTNRIIRRAEKGKGFNF